MTQINRQTLTSTRAKIALVVALSLTVLTAGLGSLAVITDSLTGTVTYSTASIDLQADATNTFTKSFTFEPIVGGAPNWFGVDFSNAGNSELRFSMSATATGTGGLAASNIRFAVYDFDDATVNNCATRVGGTLLTVVTATVATGSFGSAAAGQQAGDRILAPAGHDILCFKYSTIAGQPNGGDTGSQTLTFAAESTFGNP